MVGVHLLSLEKNWKDKKWNKKYLKSKGKTKGDKSFVITQSQISVILKLIFLRGRFSCQLYVLYELLFILTAWKSVKRCKIINYNQFWVSIKIPLEMKSQWNNNYKDNQEQLGSGLGFYSQKS